MENEVDPFHTHTWYIAAKSAKEGKLQRGHTLKHTQTEIRVEISAGSEDAARKVSP